MSAKVKLVSCIVGLIIAIGMLVVGVLAATQQKILMQGNVNFVIGNRELYVRDVRMQNSMESPLTVPGFKPGFINGEFKLNLSNANLDMNTTGTFVLYFDIINLIVDGQTLEYNAVASWTGSPVAGVSFSIDEGSETIAPGTVNADDLNDSTPISGTVALEVNVNDAASFDLSNITITIIDAGKTYLPEADYAIDGGKISINGFGDASGSVVIPEKVSVAGDGLIAGDDYTVTSIGNNAFTGNTSITSVTLPDTITSIGNGAFQNCSNLTTINLPEGLTEIGNNAFNNCGNLTDIVLPDTLTTIGNNAFFNCTSISGTLNIPASVESIGSQALVLVGLEEFTVDADSQHFTAVDGILYSKDMTRLIVYPTEKVCVNFVMPNTVEIIEGGAFRICHGLSGTLTLSTSLKTIKTLAFYFCENINGTLTIPANVTTIESYAFGHSRFSGYEVAAGNTAYMSEDGVLYNKDQTTIVQYPRGKTGTSFTIPSTVTHIESHAFGSCTNLTSITLSANLESIGSLAFYRAANLTGALEIPSTVTTIGSGPFAGCNFSSFSIDNDYYTTIDGVLYNAAKTQLINYPTGITAESFTVPSTVTNIVPYAFDSATNLKSITIPSSVTTIGTEAFYHCSNLTTVTIDSPNIARQLTSRSAANYVIRYATTVYVKESAAVSLPAAFANIFQETTSDISGYNKYTSV